MKTIITITNMTQGLKTFLEKLKIETKTFEEIRSLRKRDGIYVIEETYIDRADSMEIINVYVSEDDFHPFYDVSVTEKEAKKLILEVKEAKELPYCEVTTFLFHRQNIECYDCKNCVHKCKVRTQKFERNEDINAIFDVYCKSIYESEVNDYKKIAIAVVKKWELEIDMEEFKKRINEEQVFEEFIHGEFNRFVTMAPLLQEHLPEKLHYYFHHRKLSLKEILSQRYVKY